MNETTFVQPEEQVNEPKLFAPSEDPVKTSAPITEQQKYTTSLLAAMAKQWNATSDATLASITGLLEHRISNGEEQIVRNEIADTQRQSQLSDLTRAQLEALGKQDAGELKALIERQISLSTAPPNQYALEEEGVSAIQEMGAADPAQAVGYSENMDSLSAAYEDQAKYAIWNRAYNEQWAELRQQGWAESLLDWLVIPGQGYIGQVAASDKDTAILPGYNLQEQINRLNAMPLEEYKQELPKIIENLKAYSGLFAQNQSKVVELLSRLKPTSDWGDAAMANFDLGFDVATSIPFTAAAKLARRPINMIQMLGNRKAATEVAASAITKDAMGLPDSKAGSLGNLTAENSGAVESALPGNVKPDLMDYVTPWVGIPSDVADAVKNIAAAAAKAVGLKGVASSSPEATKQAINEFVERLEARFRREGEDIADVHRVPQLDTLDPEALAAVHRKIAQEVFIDEEGNLVPYSPLPSRALPVEAVLRDRLDIHPDAELGLQTVSFYIGNGARAGGYLTREMAVEGARKRGFAVAGEPEVPPGTVRMYHGGAITDTGYPLWFTTHRPKAQGYADKSGGEVQYVDLPENHPAVTPDYPDQGVKQGFTFERELSAVDADKRKPLTSSDGVKIIESNGQWYIKVTETVPDSGSATIRANDDLYPVNVVSQYLRNPQQALPDLINDARLQAYLERGNIESEVFAPIAKNIHVLSPRQLRRHNKIVTKGQDQRKWFKHDELVAEYEAEFGRGPTNKEIIAYYSHLQLVETTDSIINDYLYSLRAKGGWQTGEILNTRRNDLMKGMLLDRENIGFNTGRMNMREIQSPEWGKLRIFDYDDNITLHPGEGPAVADLRKRAQEKWNSGNYRLLELEEEVMHNGDPVKYVLVHKGSSRVGPLERRQRKSVPGGRKENLNKHFVAQARVGKFKGTEAGWALNPIIHLSERTATRARERMAQLEAARLAWNKEGIYAAADEVTRRKVVEMAVESMEKWQKLIDDGVIQPKSPFQYVEDRQLPAEYENLPDGAQRWFNQEWTGSDHFYTSRRELYYQTERDMLLDSAENAVRNLDPTRVLNRAITTAINTKAFANYNQRVIEDWVGRLPPGAIVEGSVGYSKDPYTIFFHGRFSEQFKRAESTRQLYQRLEANRRIHHRFMNYRDKEQSLRELFNRRIASWIDGKGELRDWAATKFYDSQSKNPVDAVQGFVFDSYLGFFNPDQFFVQTQTAALIHAMHPVYGTQATAMAPWMTHMLLNRSDNLLDMYAKRLKHIHGLPEDEFKLMVNSLRESGWMKVQGSVLQLDYLTNRLGGSRIGKAFDKFRRGGRVLFNLAERYNRLTAFQVAWHDVRKHFPDLKPGSEEFMVKLRTETDALTMNMTAASKAAWQEGIAAVPTKFIAYQAHTLENLLPKKFGGSTKLRGEQKLRLALGQLALYGLGGGYGAYSLVDYIQDSYKSATGMDMPEEAYKLAQRGSIDTLLNVITFDELDTDISSRVGFGAGMLNWYQKITEGDFATSVDIFGGPTASLSHTWIDAVTKVSRYIRTAEVHKVTPEEWQLTGNELLSTIKSWKNISKFWATYRLGQLTDPKTGQPIVEASELDSIAALLGFPMGSQTEFWREMRSEKKRDELSDDLAQQLAMLRRLGFQALAKGDERASKSYNTKEGQIFDLIGEDYQMKRMVQRKLSQLLGYNDYNIDTLQQRVQQNQGRELRAGRPN